MVWMIVIIAIALIGAGAMVAAGAFAGMRPVADDDDFVPTLPPTRMSATDLAQVRFQVQLRGYDMTTVDELLQRLGREIDQRDGELAELRERAAGVAAHNGLARSSPAGPPDAE